MSELKKRIDFDMKSAMRAKDKDALKAIRMVLGAIKQKEIDERIELDDKQTISVIQKIVKQHKDSISQFKDAARNDLVAVEEAELAIINRYMPKQLSETEIASIVDTTIKNANASSIKDMGKLMGLLKPKLGGRADMAVVSQLIRTKLS